MASNIEPITRLAVYASVGARLDHYDLDVDVMTLNKRGSIMCPAKVQCGCPHASGPFLYVVSTNRVRLTGESMPGDKHYASAYRIDSVTGALTEHGAPAMLRSRPVHVTTDIPSNYLLTAYTDSNGITSHRINSDGTVGEEIKPAAPLDVGIFPHQTRVVPTNRTAILVTRGHGPEHGKPEQPGALKVLNFNQGVLSPQASIAPNGGYGFGARHLDFHPTKPWIYLALERQNKLYVFQLEGDGLRAQPLFTKETLKAPSRAGPRQMVGTILVHPSGKFVYVINRAYQTKDDGGVKVFSGGDNDIAVFAINQETGEPTLIQNADTHGYYARTFEIDPSGRMIVVAHVIPMNLKEGSKIRRVPASLALFRIGDDGKVELVRKYDVDVGSELMFWMGMAKVR